MMKLGWIKHDGEWSMIVERYILNLLYTLAFDVDVQSYA